MRITFIFFALFLSVMTAWGATSTLPKVTGVSASKGSLYGKVNITWKANVLATGYDLYKSTSSSTSGTLIASNLTGLSFDDTRVYPSDSYYYRVVAKNAKGSAPPSANNKGWGKVPGSVSTLTATQGTAVNSVQLNWIDVPDATRYKVYRSTIPNSLMTLVGTATTNSHIDSITGTETTYYYRVTALVVNAEGLLSGKTTNEASWLKSPLPEQVTGVSATQGTLYGKVNVTWSASMLPGAYDIYRSTSDGLKGDLVAADILVTHFEDTRVSGSASYYYTVVATNTFGNAPDSAQAVGSGKVPATLTSLTATQGAVTGLVMLSWSSDADSTGYEIWRRSSLIEAPVFIQTTTYTTFFDTSVSGVANYYYIVKNRMGNVTGSFSSEAKGYANAAPTTATILIETTANAVSPETSPSITDANSEAGQDESFAFAITEQTMVGSVSVNAGKFTYSPPADGIFSGPQPFKFNVTDKGGETLLANGAVNVICESPVISSLSASSVFLPFIKQEYKLVYTAFACNKDLSGSLTITDATDGGIVDTLVLPLNQTGKEINLSAISKELPEGNYLANLAIAGTGGTATKSIAFFAKTVPLPVITVSPSIIDQGETKVVVSITPSSDTNCLLTGNQLKAENDPNHCFVRFEQSVADLKASFDSKGLPTLSGYPYTAGDFTVYAVVSRWVNGERYDSAPLTKTFSVNPLPLPIFSFTGKSSVYDDIEKVALVFKQSSGAVCQLYSDEAIALSEAVNGKRACFAVFTGDSDLTHSLSINQIKFEGLLTTIGTKTLSYSVKRVFENGEIIEVAVGDFPVNVIKKSHLS